MTKTLSYTDSDGSIRILKGCSLTQDKAERYWLWSEQLEQNLAYKIKNKEDCLIAAIDSLLFLLYLREERLKTLEKIVSLAEAFADQIKLEEQNDF